MIANCMAGMISTALRTGTPLPQITPAPLLDRFLREHPGLNVLQQEAADEAGLPRTVTFDTLQDEQYMYISHLTRGMSIYSVFTRYFSVGVSHAHGIVSRLDRLMLATKELVGERFHVDGIRFPSISSDKLDGNTQTKIPYITLRTITKNDGENV